MSHKIIHGFKSTSGDQYTYYFTDAQEDDLAMNEAKSQAKKFFGKRAKVIKLKTEFPSLPEHAPELYKWFVGVKDQWA